MTGQKPFLQQQALRVLSEEKYALLLATVFAAVPYLSFLSLVIVGLVTLRHGGKAGFQVFLPVLLMHVLVAVIRLPLHVALLMSVLGTLPCYLAAYFLKVTSSWRFVAIALLALVLGSAVCLHVFSSDFILQQYLHLLAALQHLTAEQSLLDFWANKGVTSPVFANYLLGVQGASLVFSAMLLLLFARQLQSQLFYPEGFRAEMQNFRGKKVDCAVVLLLLVLAYFENFLAINCLPLALLYCAFSGLSFVAYCFSNMRPLGLMLLLVLPTIFLAWVFLPLYALLGALDSVFNFRLYLSHKTGKAT